MRKSGKRIAGFLCLVMVLVGIQTCLVGAKPRYVQGSRASTTLQIASNTATCIVKVVGKDGTSKITGTIRLYDDTTNTYVGTWNVNITQPVYVESKSASVKSGHQYTLSFVGNVYNANGVGERIASSTTKVN